MERLNIQDKAGIYIVAAFIIAMPLMIYSLTKWFALGETIEFSSLDIFWSAFCFLAGLALLVRLKIAWLFSMATVILVALLNLSQLLLSRHAESTLQYNLQFLFSVAMLSALFLIASYFKYPYLDRRDTIFYGIADRYKVNFQGMINETIPVEITSASISGARVKPRSADTLREGLIYNLSSKELDFTNQPFVVIRNQNGESSIKYENIGLSQVFAMRKKLKNMPKDV